MTAKNKGDFLYELHNELHRIGIDDDEEIVSDFEEHFKASREAGLSEEEACEKLGDAKEIARSYLDIESARINSIVADAVANKRVSLTKPGEKLPADLSLLKEEETAQPPVREFTPEHIAQEPEAPKPSVPRAEPNMGGEPVREFTPKHIRPEQPSPAPTAGSADKRYRYSAGTPPKGAAAAGGSGKNGGFRFGDIMGMKPNLNVGKLVTCLVFDIFLWSWLVPLVISAVIGGLGAVALGLLTGGFSRLGDVQNYHIISRIFFCMGTVSGAVLVGCAMFALCRLVFRWVKHIVISHIKAVYDL